MANELDQFDYIPINCVKCGDPDEWHADTDIPSPFLCQNCKLSRQQKRHLIHRLKKMGIDTIDFEPILDYDELRNAMFFLRDYRSQQVGKLAMLSPNDIIGLLKGEIDEHSREMETEHTETEPMETQPSEHDISQTECTKIVC